MMNYHFHSAFYSDPDHNLVGFHLEEAVYAPLYYGYGSRGEYGDRAALARSFDEEVMQHAPDTVLVLLRARPEVIARSACASSRTSGRWCRKRTSSTCCSALEEEYRDSLIRKKFALDTSDATVEQTLAEFAGEIKQHLSETDRLRLLAHQNWPT